MRSFAHRFSHTWVPICLVALASCSTETDKPGYMPMAAAGGIGGASGLGGVGGNAAAGSGGSGGGIPTSGGTGGAGGSSIPTAGSGGSGGMMAGAGGVGGMMAGGVGGMMAGDGGTGGMMAGAGGAGGATEMSDCGSDGIVGEPSNAGSGSGSGYANVRLAISADNQIVRLRTTLEVPVEPDGNTTLFIWPGLEPLSGGANYQPIGTGVLQPVLTWGGSCAPGSPQSLSGDHWWISAQYVNTLGSHEGHTGCHGGDILDVEIGDQLVIDMSLDGTVWKQTVTNEESGMAVDFDMDLEAQAQRWALFEIERATSSSPASDIVFTNTTLVFENPEPPEACTPTRGTNDYYSAPIASQDGLRCCFERIVLREQGVAATTMDPPP